MILVITASDIVACVALFSLQNTLIIDTPLTLLYKKIVPEIFIVRAIVVSLND